MPSPCRVRRSRGRRTGRGYRSGCPAHPSKGVLRVYASGRLRARVDLEREMLGHHISRPWTRAPSLSAKAKAAVKPLSGHPPFLSARVRRLLSPDA